MAGRRERRQDGQGWLQSARLLDCATTRLDLGAQYLPAERDERGLGGHVEAELERFFTQVAAQDEWLREYPPRIAWLIEADCAETPGDHSLT